jgi:hypothetical protein
MPYISSKSTGYPRANYLVTTSLVPRYYIATTSLLPGYFIVYVPE